MLHKYLGTENNKNGTFSWHWLGPTCKPAWTSEYQITYNSKFLYGLRYDIIQNDLTCIVVWCNGILPKEKPHLKNISCHKRMLHSDAKLYFYWAIVYMWLPIFWIKFITKKDKKVYINLLVDSHCNDKTFLMKMFLV